MCVYLKGTAASEGIGIGKVLAVKKKEIAYKKHDISDIQAELLRYREAVTKFIERTRKIADRVAANTGEKEAEILRGHILMINDPYMNSEIEKLIESGQCAEDSLSAICDSFIKMFSSVDDEITKQRAVDVVDIKAAILSILLGIEEVSLKDVPPKTIIVADELTPSMTSDMNSENIVGIVTEHGGENSHSSIIARALGIPAVLNVENALDKLETGDIIVVDGIRGEVVTELDDAVLDEYYSAQSDFDAQRRELELFKNKPTVTADGVEKKLFCNIGSADDALKAKNSGGEGIGLFRTELMFLKKDRLPTEDEQLAEYKRVALTFDGKPVTIRTLDIGGDKNIPYLGLEKEENPYLGNRAIRYCLKHKDIFRTQLRAILRASAFGKIKIMIPLITCVDELQEAKAIIEDIKAELRNKSIEFDENIEVGIMIETPAASLIADLLAEEADFFSIGTNDLTQYTMAVDRGNAEVAYLYSPRNIAVVRSIKHIIECAHEKGIKVGMCGEAAANPDMIPMLVEFGLDEFSVSPSAVLKTRQIISKQGTV